MLQNFTKLIWTCISILEQKKDLRHIGRNNSNETVITKGLEMIDDMHDQPNKYSMLIEALQDAGWLILFPLVNSFWDTQG